MPASAISELSERVLRVIEEAAGRPHRSVRLGDQLSDDLGMDALGRVELALRIEGAFDVPVDLAAETGWNTPADVVALVQRHRSS